MNLKWKIRYLLLAMHVSSWSKDPSTKVGSIAVNDKGQVLSQGYNGFPRHIEDTEERYSDREKKYKYIVHAEMNLIYNATYTGVSLDGSTLFVHGLPMCSDCTKGILQCGIKHIVMPLQEIPDKWLKSWEHSKSMLDESNVTWEFISLKEELKTYNVNGKETIVL